MLELPSTFILFDTEFTSWEGAQERKWSGPNEFREIVQIGAIRVNEKRLEETASLLLYVKPVRNPMLSDYFIQLTGITQKDVEEKGTDFPTAVGTFSDWVGNTQCYCFGSDAKVMAENCALLDVPFPFSWEQFHNVKEVFMKHGIDTAGYMSSTIVRAFGVEPKRRGHDGLADARTILDGLRLLRQKEEKED